MKRIKLSLTWLLYVVKLSYSEQPATIENLTAQHKFSFYLLAKRKEVTEKTFGDSTTRGREKKLTRSKVENEIYSFLLAAVETTLKVLIDTSGTDECSLLI